MIVQEVETGSSDPRRIIGVQASSGFFRLLGLRPVRGRWPSAGESGGVVLSHRLWSREFGEDPALSELRLRIGGDSYPVVAVASPSFQGLVPGIAPGYWKLVETMSGGRSRSPACWRRPSARSEPSVGSWW